MQVLVYENPTRTRLTSPLGAWVIGKESKKEKFTICCWALECKCWDAFRWVPNRIAQTRRRDDQGLPRYVGRSLSIGHPIQVARKFLCLPWTTNGKEQGRSLFPCSHGSFWHDGLKKWHIPLLRIERCVPESCMHLSIFGFLHFFSWYFLQLFVVFY